MSLLSLAQAISASRQKLSETRDVKVRIYSNLETKQLSIFLQAYLRRAGVNATVDVIPYGSLLSALSMPSQESIDYSVVLIDSDSAGIGMSLRAARFASGGADAIEARRGEFERALRSIFPGFSERSSGKIFVSPVALWSPAVVYSPPGYPTDIERRWSLGLIPPAIQGIP